MRPVAPVGLALALAALLLAATPTADAWVAGWDRPHHADLAEAAADRLPEPHRTWLHERMHAFRKGALDPDGVTDPARAVDVYYHAYEPHADAGGGAYMAQRALLDAVMALRDDAPDAAYKLGVITHFATDLSMPLHTGADVPAWPGSLDLVFHPHHEPYEHDAYDHRHEYDATPQRAPLALDAHEVRPHVVDTARASAALAPALLDALERSDGAWTPEAADITGRSARLAVERASDLLLTAFELAASADAQTLAALDPAPYEPGVADRLRDSVLQRPGAPQAALVPVAAVAALLAVRGAQTARERARTARQP